MNKLTVGLESHMSLSGPCFSSGWFFEVFLGFSGFIFSLPSSDPRCDRKSYVTSDRCDVTPLDALPQICQLSAQTVLGLHSRVDDIIFFHSLQWLLTHHTYCIMLRSVHITSYKIFNDCCQFTSSSQMPQFYLQVNVSSNVSPAVRLESNSAHPALYIKP